MQIKFDPDKANVGVVFTVTQVMDLYEAMGETIRRALNPAAQGLYLGAQALQALGEISEERKFELLRALTEMDDSIRTVGERFSALFSEIKEKYHVKSDEEQAVEDDDEAWPPVIG